MPDYAQADLPNIESAVAGVDLLARKTLLFRPDPQPKALFAAIVLIAPNDGIYWASTTFGFSCEGLRLKKSFTLRTLASLVKSRCASARQPVTVGQGGARNSHAVNVVREG